MIVNTSLTCIRIARWRCFVLSACCRSAGSNATQNSSTSQNSVTISIRESFLVEMVLSTSILPELDSLFLLSSTFLHQIHVTLEKTSAAAEVSKVQAG